MGIIWIGRCKTHLENLSACARTSVVFDRLGREINHVPRFSPRAFTTLGFDRPECPICKSLLKTGKLATRMVVRAGKISEEKVLRLYCDGGRWGKPKHAMKTRYVNSKGGEETVPRGKHRRISEMPVRLRENYPICCNKPMARQNRKDWRNNFVFQMPDLWQTARI
jgi:hypothetical protein